MFSFYSELEENTENTITYFEGKEKFNKSFKEFVLDVKTAVRKLSFLGIQEGEKVGIIGYTTYAWMVLDHACILIGVQSIAIPETFSKEQQKAIEEKVNLKCCLVDFAYKDQIGVSSEKVYFFNCKSDCNNNFSKIEEDEQFDFSINRIQEDYTIVFSSGTSEKIKYIRRCFIELTEKERKEPSILKKIKYFFQVKWRGSIWTELKGKKNKIIIPLPFSHPMQREFAMNSLKQKINIILSNPQNCIKHIMLEKPNIMINVPPLYDALAALIKARISKFSEKEQEVYKYYLKKGINKKSNKSKEKQYYQNTLFKKVKKIYGGHADLFITGSAPIKKETLEIFYNVGVKVYEAYGQSEGSINIMNNPKRFKIGSIGKPSKKTVKLGDNNEILIKFNKWFDSKNIDVLNVENNFIKTGDTGYFDNEGFLYVTGRLDDVIVLDRGKKVHPKTIEEKFDSIHSISNVCVFSKNRHEINAIIFSDNKDEENIKSVIKNINNRLVEHEAINEFVLINEKPSLENGLLTRTLKLKRKLAIALFDTNKSIFLNDN